jgi:hypothetical protein
MDGPTPALVAAIDLLHLPSFVRLVRRRPLPDGVLILLRIVAGEPDATQKAAAATGQPEETVRAAAAFFIEQILLHADAEPYRVLGARPDASAEDLRRNMALLLRWLHPDRNGVGERSVFAARVTLAWEHLKTPERRDAYDEAERNAAAKPSRMRGKSRTLARSARHVGAVPVRGAAQHGRPPGSGRMLVSHDRPGGLLRRALLFLLGGARR